MVIVSTEKFKMGLKRCCHMNPILMQHADSGRKVGKAYCPEKAMQMLLLKPDTYQEKTQVSGPFTCTDSTMTVAG